MLNMINIIIFDQYLALPLLLQAAWRTNFLAVRGGTETGCDFTEGVYNRQQKCYVKKTTISEARRHVEVHEWRDISDVQ